MAKTVSTGYVDTKPGSSATYNVARPALNFKTDFAVAAESEGKTTLINLTTPVDQSESVRFQISDVKDIYSGTSIDPSVYAASRAGISLLVQDNVTLRVTDSTDPGFQQDIPLSAHLVIKTAKSQYVTAEVVQNEILRLLSMFYGTGSETTDRINALMRGSMTPSDL